VTDLIELSVAVSVSPLNALDGIAIRIGDLRGAQLAIEKVAGGREQWRASGD
jgi:hypothetical protein